LRFTEASNRKLYLGKKYDRDENPKALYQYLAEELKTVKKTNDCSDVRRDIFMSRWESTAYSRLTSRKSVDFKYRK